MDSQELKRYVENNPRLITMRSAGPDIYILKYKKRVFFDDLWNRYTEECRGTIVDKDFKVISRPFTKIYNYGIEKLAPTLAEDTPVHAIRKVNGFMLAATWYRGELLLSTTGSTDSPYVDMARDFVDVEKFSRVCTRSPGLFTYMFEVVHPNDPHIIKEEPGLYYLGARHNMWNSSVTVRDIPKMAEMFGVEAPEEYHVTMGELLKMAKECRYEGYVFYTKDGVSAKIKSPFYLMSKWVARNPRTDKLMTKEFKEQIDEEFYPVLEAIRANIEEYTALTEQQRLEWVRQRLDN